MDKQADRRGRVLLRSSAVFLAAGVALWLVTDYRVTHDSDLHELEHLDGALLAILLALIGVVLLLVGLAQRSTPVAWFVLATLVCAFSLLQGGLAWRVSGLVSLALALLFAGRWIRDLPSGPGASGGGGGRR